ncbi:hypothetical protein HDV06_004601 [Boothiomyces sp. JEL0866]|nr:hypothetical protein HDV06_004601 [Boothiomyces sp. JEL0866]
MAETQNSTQLNVLIEQRILTLKYLSRIFDGHGRYLGTVKIPLGKLYEMYSSPPGYKRSEQLFQLGISLGTLARISEPIGFSKAVDTLISEYEVYISEQSQSAVSRVFSRLSRARPDTNLMESSLLLDIRAPPFNLDFINVFRTVADILLITYEKLKPNTNSEAYFELVNKLDQKIWKLAIAPVMRDLDALCGDLLSAELAKLIETKSNSYS